MSRLERAAGSTYGRHLNEGEEVLATADGFAADSGRTVLYAIVVGGLTGALMWTLLDGSGLIPHLVLGALTGTLVGVAIATRQARGNDGPGALIVKVVLTNTRLLLLRGRSAGRLKPLRALPLETVAGLDNAPAAIGDYTYLVIRLKNGVDIRLLITGAGAASQLVAEHHVAVSPEPPASQDSSNG